MFCKRLGPGAGVAEHEQRLAAAPGGGEVQQEGQVGHDPGPDARGLQRLQGIAVPHRDLAGSVCGPLQPRLFAASGLQPRGADLGNLQEGQPRQQAHGPVPLPIGPGAGDVAAGQQHHAARRQQAAEQEPEQAARPAAQEFRLRGACRQPGRNVRPVPVRRLAGEDAQPGPPGGFPEQQRVDHLVPEVFELRIKRDIDWHRRDFPERTALKALGASALGQRAGLL